MDATERDRIMTVRLAICRRLRQRRRVAGPPVEDQDREPHYDPAEIAARIAAIRETKPEPARRRVTVLVCRDVRWAEKGDHNG